MEKKVHGKVLPLHTIDMWIAQIFYTYSSYILIYS